MKRADDETSNQQSINGLILNESTNTIIKTKRSDYSDRIDKLNKSVNETLLNHSSQKQKPESTKPKLLLKIIGRSDQIKSHLELKEDKAIIPLKETLLNTEIYLMTNQNRVLKKVERLVNYYSFYNIYIYSVIQMMKMRKVMKKTITVKE